jgi:hypothetical protein
MPTTAQIVENTPIAVYLASNAIEKNGYTGRGFLDKKLAIKIRIAYKFVKEIYDIDPDYDGMYEVCNWMWELCGVFGAQAMGISGSGGSVAPPSSVPTAVNFGEYVRRITATNFTNGTDYDDVWIAGYEAFVLWNNIPRYLTPGVEVRYTPSGFTIWIDDGAGGNGFNANTTQTDVEMYVFKRFPSANAAVTEVLPVLITYDLTANTEIANIDLSNYSEDQEITFSIQANGFDYTWASQFEWSDNQPVQPLANTVNTYSLYDFKVIVNKLVCIGQSLNIPI